MISASAVIFSSLESSSLVSASSENSVVSMIFYHVRQIHQRWLNQRGQRHSYTWAAYTELMRLLALETTANHATGQAITLVLLRKRVFTKSPVRENRTPGSVRGLSGNWQSYRNQLPLDANQRNVLLHALTLTFQRRRYIPHVVKRIFYPRITITVGLIRGWQH